MLVGPAGARGPQASGVARGQTSGRDRNQARRMASPGVGPAEASAKDGFESTWPQPRGPAGRKLIAWADSFDGVLDDRRPPKPPIMWAGADDAANTARVTAYTKAATLWRAKHDRWQAANMKRKAQRRAERDGERDWADECRARRQRRLKVPEPHPHPCAHAHAYEHSCPCPRIRAGALERRRPRRARPTAAGRRAGRGRAADTVLWESATFKTPPRENPFFYSPCESSHPGSRQPTYGTCRAAAVRRGPPSGGPKHRKASNSRISFAPIKCAAPKTQPTTLLCSRRRADGLLSSKARNEILR